MFRTTDKRHRRNAEAEKREEFLRRYENARRSARIWL
jgi:hypothetical protein